MRLLKVKMLATKLILIEGLGGSGKTSTVSYLNDFLCRRNFDVTAIYERSNRRPKCKFPAFAENYVGEMLAEWRLFLDERVRVNNLCVMEGHGWQPMAEFMYLAGHSRQSVLDFCGKIESIISPLNPAVIYYAVDNIAEHLERIAQMRGRDWIRLMEQRDVEHHGLDAFGGSLLQFWDEWNVLQNEIFSHCRFPKLRVENPHDDWGATYKEIASFLQIS